MKIVNTIIAIAVLATMCACKNGRSADSAASQDGGMKVVVNGFTDTVELELVPMDEPDPEPAAPAESYFDRKARSGGTAAAAPARQAATATKANGKAETIYVETDGAQGRVWGHVTLKGDRGTGTIHDWDENTLTVSVTRHGNELFAVDQNSRQYVFKLK